MADKTLAPDEDFPELQAFLADQKARHIRLVRLVLAGSAALLAAGVALLIFADAERRAGFVLAGLFLVGFGVLGIARGLLSKLTEIDTRARPEFFDVVFPEDFQRGPAEEEQR